MRAGTNIVGQYWESSMDLLLPALLTGVFNDNWRIQDSSIVLLGEFLNKIILLPGGSPSKDPSTGHLLFLFLFSCINLCRPAKNSGPRKKYSRTRYCIFSAI